MGIFTSRARQSPALSLSTPETELSECTRQGLPTRFEVVAEALMAGRPALEACTVVGRELARDGASLAEALEGLRATYAMVRGVSPDYDDTVALSVAWSEATLGYLHQLSCDDPLTGLSSLAHVRSRLSELYRAQALSGVSVRDSHALVVADLPQAQPVETGLAAVFAPRRSRPDTQKDRLSRTLHLTRLGESARTVFSGTETIGRLGPNRILVIADRDERLGQRVALLRRLVSSLDLRGQSPRVWIEGLPAVDGTAAGLLDELARP